MDPAEMDAPPPATSFPTSSSQQMDPAVPASSTATVAAPTGPRGDGNKAALDAMAGPSVMPLQLEEGDPEGDIDKQMEMWEDIDEQRQLWDAHDEQQKLRKKDEKRQKHEERRQKQEERRQKQDENKKIKSELAQKKVDKKKLGLSLRKKELQIRRDKKSTEMNSAHKLKGAVGGGSPRGVTRSSGVNYLKSRLGVLAKVAASKRGRPLSDIEGSSDSQKDGKSVASSPSLLSSPSPATSSLGGSRIKHPRGRKVRRLTSDVWKDFSPRYNNGKLVQAVCKHCEEVMAAGRDMGTSGVRRHLATCPIRSDLRLIVDKLKSSVTSPSASVLKNWEFDQKISRQLLARMIVRDEMPFSIVQYSGFVDFVKSLNPLFKMVSRNTIKDDIMQLYYDKKSYMEKGFKMFAGRVSLTTDMWTSNQTLGYMCVTCHFIDMNWKLHKKIIRFCMLETPHNGDAMFNVLLKSLQEWNLEDKLFSVTVDNASVNGSMLDNLRENLVSKEMLHYEGQLLHIRCACHVFNLIVQDGLVAVKGSIDNVRESVKYVKSSQTRLENFTEIVGRVGVSCPLPSVDVQTRWNSTYLMLESAMPFRKAFHILAKEDKNYKFCPSSTEWRRAETVCSILKVFHCNICCEFDW